MYDSWKSLQWNYVLIHPHQVSLLEYTTYQSDLAYKNLQIPHKTAQREIMVQSIICQI